MTKMSSLCMVSSKPDVEMKKKESYGKNKAPQGTVEQNKHEKKQKAITDTNLTAAVDESQVKEEESSSYNRLQNNSYYSIQIWGVYSRQYFQVNLKIRFFKNYTYYFRIIFNL